MSASDLLLAIESSCDETGAAVIRRDLAVLSNVIASQNELHERFGGVVPEIASRAHVRCILPVIDEALRKANVKLGDLSAIAVVTQPGLVGSLLVGLTAAKTLALATGLPLVAVNHIEAHLYACRMEAGRDIFPAIGLVVSGGHTTLFDCHAATEFEWLGGTIDDAAGEAFDKVAQILGLPYPGGPAIEQAARSGDPKAFDFPRVFLNEKRLEFSFSGLKTAVLYKANGIPSSRDPVPELTPQRVADLAASFQAAALEVLVGKCKQTLRQRNRSRLLVGGGVAANTTFRQQLEEMCRRQRVELFIAPHAMCTDNAAMGAIAWESLAQGRVADLDLDVTPGLVRGPVG